MSSESTVSSSSGDGTWYQQVIKEERQVSAGVAGVAGEQEDSTQSSAGGDVIVEDKREEKVQEADDGQTGQVSATPAGAGSTCRQIIICCTGSAECLDRIVRAARNIVAGYDGQAQIAVTQVPTEDAPRPPSPTEASTASSSSSVPASASANPKTSTPVDPSAPSHPSEAFREPPVSSSFKKVTKLDQVNLSSSSVPVCVSHVVHQGEFYVQRRADAVHINAMSERLRRHGESAQLPPLRRAPEEGEFLMARYSADGCWYRCRVVRVKKEGVEVQYVDYGNREIIVRSSDLKPLPESLSKQHAFAVECGLGHLKPSSDALWKGEARAIFAKLFAQEGATYLLRPLGRDESSGAIHADIALPASTDFVEADEPVSASDMLAFFGFVDGQVSSPCGGLRKRDLTKCTMLSTAKTYSVTVCFALDPGHFYVHFTEQKARLEELQEAIEKFYSDKWHLLRHGPVFEGMLVMAVSPEDKRRYRARVLKVEGPSKITVHLVDHGKTLVVNWPMIFKLADRFLDVPEMAHLCSLALRPRKTKTGSEWRQDVVEYFTVLTGEGRVLDMRLLPDTVGKQSAKSVVELSNSNCDRTVNEAMEIRIEQRGGGRPPPPPSQSVTARRLNTSVASPKEDSRNGSSANSAKMIKFYITHAESPSEIWARPEVIDRAWLEFSRKMDEALSAEKKKSEVGRMPKKEIVPGKAVVVEVGLGHHYRAVVLKEAEEGGGYQVRLVDRGEVRTVPAEGVWGLPDGLARRRAFCHCVKLHNVRPLGTADGNWSASAREALQDVLRKLPHVFLSIEAKPVEEDGLTKLPVMLYFEEDRTADAFGATCIERTDVASVLKEKGLLLHDGQKKGIDKWTGDSMGPFLDCGLLEEGDRRAEAEAASNVTSKSSPRSRKKSSGPGSEPAPSSTNSDLTLPPAGASWPPPVLPDPLSSFTGTVSYLDDEAQLYVQTGPQSEAVRRVDAELREAYSGERGARQKSLLDAYWRAGEVCVAKYPGAEDGWHRGLVTAVGETVVKSEVVGQGVEVLFVDYGERKVLCPTKGELYKAVPRHLLDVPIQVLRCKLDNVVPIGGSYPKTFLDDFHPKIVDRAVQVEVKRAKDADCFPLPVFLHYRDGERRNLARVWTELGICRKINSRKEWYDVEATVRQEKVAFGIQPRKSQQHS